MDMSKKSLILGLVATFVCVAVSIVCLVVMKCNWVSIALSAVIVGLAVYICIFCWKVAKNWKKENQEK